MPQPHPAIAGVRPDQPHAPGLGPWHAAVALATLPWLLRGPSWALAALAAGLAVVAGTWLSGRIALGGGVQSSGGALARLLAGMMLKWVVVIGVLAIGAASGLAPLPMLTGVIAALVAQMVAASGRAQARKAI